MRGEFNKLLGKTIKGIQVREDATLLSSQLFLVFDDNTYFEIYSDGPINGIQRTYPGDMKTIRSLSPGNSSIVIDVEQSSPIKLSRHS